ncbi:MAG: NAD(P)/FAD-dependent oxidoreductase [Desulfovibrio sp.]|nr:NAD(P)/FAD-dependent oxidoreductase [Desulfovibrio sp.]
MTFFSRLHPRVSFVGEVLDVTGLLGGFNLHWAFASGWLAAEALARRLAS